MTATGRDSAIRHDLPPDVVQALRDAYAVLVTWQLPRGLELEGVIEDVRAALETHWVPETAEGV